MKKLLFILPNKENKEILTIDKENENQVPTFNKLVNDNVGFENPDIFNEYFLNLTGIPVFRRYSFIFGDYCVFVLEIARNYNALKSYCKWSSYEEVNFKLFDNSILEIIISVKNYYNYSINMPWVNENGFSLYMDWLNNIALLKRFSITGEIRQIKNAYVSNVFMVSTDIGNLYLKIPVRIYIKELEITSELKNWDINKLPNLFAYDSSINAILMNDMGGYDLKDKADIDELKTVVSLYARIQIDSLKYLEKNPTVFYDYSVDSLLSEIETLSTKIHKILFNTQYYLCDSEFNKLDFKINEVKQLLNLLKNFNIPNTIEHGDLRPGNIRVTEKDYILYDWAWSSITHPFISLSTFLHIIRREITAHDKDILIENYLGEWKAFGDINILKEAFFIIDKIKYFYMIYTDYKWLEEIINKTTTKIDEKSADGWLISRRYYYFCRVLKRFIEE